jgi:hypothetical protein
MGNQAVGLKRQIQQSDAFEEDRETTQKTAEYQSEMTRNPEFRPDPNAVGYNPKADMGAQAAYLAQQIEWNRLDSGKQKLKSDQLSDDYEQSQRAASDVTSWLRIATSQYPDAETLEDLPKDIRDKIVDSFVGAHAYIPDGRYSEKNADGTVTIKGQFNDYNSILDPSKISVKDVEEFWAGQSMNLTDKSAFTKAFLASESATNQANAGAWSNPRIVFDPNSNTRAFRVDQVHKKGPKRGKVESYYFDHFPIMRDDVPMSPDQVGKFSVDLGLVNAQKYAPEVAEEEAKTGMTAAQQADKGFKERELGQHEKQLGLAASKETREQEKADMEKEAAPQKANQEAVKAYNDYLKAFELNPKEALSFKDWKEQIWTYREEGPKGLSGKTGESVKGKIGKPRTIVDKKTGRTYKAYSDGKIGLPNGKKVTVEEFKKMTEGQ